MGFLFLRSGKQVLEKIQLPDPLLGPAPSSNKVGQIIPSPITGCLSYHTDTYFTQPIVVAQWLDRASKRAGLQNTFIGPRDPINTLSVKQRVREFSKFPSPLVAGHRNSTDTLRIALLLSRQGTALFQVRKVNSYNRCCRIVSE